jgi:hypothetical protein
MQLKEFITETFKEIVDGVVAAQEYSGAKGARVNPSGLTCRLDQGLMLYDKKTGDIATLIEFDVAVTTAEGTATKGGVGVFVGPVALGSQGQSDAAKSSNSRIRFSVPMHLPKVF